MQANHIDRLKITNYDATELPFDTREVMIRSEPWRSTLFHGAPLPFETYQQSQRAMLQSMKSGGSRALGLLLLPLNNKYFVSTYSN